MVCAARLAKNIGMLTAAEAIRITELINNYGLPVDYGNLSADAIVERMRSDKKNTAGQISLVLPAAIGQSQVCTGISDEQIKAV